ncbi:MAG: AAA family ATPase [Mobilicoccus sp.]|nr:AAA family ATPase [Mobilicoccus sp.]
MDRALNPYSPGAGRPPVAFVGRDAELQAWNVALTRLVSGRSGRPLALYGLRGVGKTVLLNRLRRDAEERGWIVASVEAGAGRSLRESLGEALYGPLSDLARPTAGRRIVQALRTALSFKASYDSTGTWSFGLDLPEAPGGGADSGVLETDLAKLVKDVSAAAAEDGVGLALLIDEAQDVEVGELAALCAVTHRATQEGWPFLVALAGLPSLPRDLAEAKSYAERLFEFHRVHALPADQAEEAVLAPARSEGVQWDNAALQVVLDTAGGYPYFLQQFGEGAWNQATEDPISETAARVGTAEGLQALDNGFFRSRWERATRAEREYLRAMAVDGDDGSSSGEVARRLGRPIASLGPARGKLIAKGLVYAPEHGRVAFTVPRMADFISRQPED